MAPSKKCPNCQTDNNLDAKYCFKCGAGLPQMETSDNFCGECGFDNPPESKYCASCGSLLGTLSEINTARKGDQPVQRKKSTRQKKRKKKTSVVDKSKHRKSQQLQINWNPKIVGLVLAGVALIAVYAIYMNQKSLKMSERYFENISSNSLIETQMRKIASRFVCACGSCPSEPLETCGCPTARKERDFIRNALSSGQREDDIVRILDKEYGGLKENQPKIDKNDINFDFSDALSINDTKGEFDLSDGQEIASIANRAKIIQEFICPCGQCGIDALKDCDCNHPRGAKEVKQFIDDQIAKGNFTVAQVIENVEQKYGSRIR